MINLYKRTHFITDIIFTTNTNIVGENLKSILDQITEDTDILCENTLFISDILEIIKPRSIKLIHTNADFTFHPLPHDSIFPNTLTCVIGEFNNGTKFKRIHQLGFIYNNHIIRIGIKI